MFSSNVNGLNWSPVFAKVGLVQNLEAERSNSSSVFELFQSSLMLFKICFCCRYQLQDLQEALQQQAERRALAEAESDSSQQVGPLAQ